MYLSISIITTLRSWTPHPHMWPTKNDAELVPHSTGSSDPAISYIRLQNRQKKLKSLPLPATVIYLLKPYDIPIEDNSMRNV